MIKKIKRNLIISLRVFIRHLLEPIFGYTRIVTGTKAILLSIAILMILIIIIAPLLNKTKKDYVTANDKENVDALTTPTMMNPTFSGMDNKNQPYNIVADTAIKTEDSKLVLTNVNADITLKNSEKITATAVQAVYTIDKRDLNLLGIVKINSSRGYDIETSTANIDLEKNTTSGRNKIKLKSDIWSLTAESFIIKDTNDLLFKGNVKMIIKK